MKTAPYVPQQTVDGKWGFRTRDGRRTGYPTRSAASLAAIRVERDEEHAALDQQNSTEGGRTL